MNVLSRNYAEKSNLFSPAFEQVTSIGIGCAAAFYFNYIRIVVPHPRTKFEKNDSSTIGIILQSTTIEWNKS